jgi:phosphonopyruvate decarboxylase
MLNTATFGNELKVRGFDFYAGVPCSFLKSLINYAINECYYVMAANEGYAVAVASGAALGGKKSVVLVNSGLTVTSATSVVYVQTSRAQICELARRAARMNLSMN